MKFLKSRKREDGYKPYVDFLPAWQSIIVIGVVISLYPLAKLALYSTPKGLKIVDEATNADRFISEYAYENIRTLSERIGVRFTGTPNNEKLTVEYLLSYAQDIQNNLHPDLELEIYHQVGNGNFHEQWQSFSSINIYRGVQNIAVRLKPKVNVATGDLLLNAHFDSVAFSPGAADDGSMTGVLLELMRVLAKKPIMRHPVIFLFNGCEENSLQGAHSFATNHPWMNNVKLLINVDSAGPQGKELMFQTSKGHSWLMKKYLDAVPHPFATVVGEEMYQNGFIPSDTDFSMFKQVVQNLSAYDLADILNGFVYHTKNDRFNFIELGTLQNTGDNLLELLKELDVAEELKAEVPTSNRSVIFFDIFGLFLIFYNDIVAAAINSIVFIAVIACIVWNIYAIKRRLDASLTQVSVEFLVAIGLQILGILIAIAFIVCTSMILNLIGKSMSWFSNTWLLFGIYFCPFTALLALPTYIYVTWRENKLMSTSYYVQLNILAFWAILALFLIILTGFGIRTAYVLLFALIFQIISTVINTATGLIHKAGRVGCILSGPKWFHVHFICQLIPILYYFYLMAIFYSTFLPTIGRNYGGQSSNPEIMIAAITGLFTLLSMGLLAPTIVLFKNRESIFSCITFTFILFQVLIWTVVGFPYTDGKQTQRYNAYHFRADFYNLDKSLRKSEAGYYLFGFDRRSFSTLDDFVPDLGNALTMERRCSNEVLCGIPHYHIYYTENAVNNYWIPVDNEPMFSRLPELVLEKVESVNKTKQKYYFVMKGTDHMSLHIAPLPGVKLVSWSFMSSVEDDYKVHWGGRDVYFVNYVHGLLSYSFSDYPFYLEFEVTSEFDEVYNFDIALAAHFIHQDDTLSPNFQSFIQKFPGWTNVQYWSNYLVSYQY